MYMMKMDIVSTYTNGIHKRLEVMWQNLYDD